MCRNVELDAVGLVGGDEFARTALDDFDHIVANAAERRVRK
jgi:hypothetical protein